MQHYAYVVGRLKLDALGAWVMVSVDVYSESAWQLTNLDNGTIFVQLAPAYEGPSFATATAAAQQDVGRRYRGLKHLFAWSR